MKTSKSLCHFPQFMLFMVNFLFDACPAHLNDVTPMRASHFNYVVSDEKNATFISENIIFRRFITSGSLHYYSKTRDYSTEPLQWSSSNAIKLKMMYHRAKKINS